MDKDKKEVGELVPDPDNDRLVLGEADGMTTFHKPKKKPPGIKPTALNKTKPTTTAIKAGVVSLSKRPTAGFYYDISLGSIHTYKGGQPLPLHRTNHAKAYRLLRLCYSYCSRSHCYLS